MNCCTGVTSNIQTQLNNKAASNHTHDDRYYTETEVLPLLSVKSNAITVITGYHSVDVSPSSSSPYASGLSSFNYDISASIPAGYKLLVGYWSVGWISGHNNGMAIEYNNPFFFSATGTASYNAVGGYRTDTGGYFSAGFRPSFVALCILA